VQQPTLRLRRSAAIFAVAVVAPILSGCASNFSSQVLQPYTPGVGVYDNTGTVEAYNMVVVVDEQGNGTLVATLINTGDTPDALTGVTAQAEDEVGTAPPQASLNGEVELQPEQPVQLSEEGAVSLTGDALQPGYFLQMSLEFVEGDTISRPVPVEAQEGPYAEVEIPEPAGS
jgi:hypothetical protein